MTSGIDVLCDYSGENFPEENSVDQTCLTFVTPKTGAHQAPRSIEFSRQEYWSGLPFHSPGNLPHPGTESGSPEFQIDSLPTEPPRKPIQFFFLAEIIFIMEDLHLMPALKHFI